MIEEPLSFVDLYEHFTKKNGNDFTVTIPIYVVNKLSGKLTIIEKATLSKNICSQKSYCTIIVLPLQRQFTPRSEDKNKNKLINIEWGSFYSGNYELFLHKNDAIMHAIDILKEKRNKINEKINNLLLIQR